MVGSLGRVGQLIGGLGQHAPNKGVGFSLAAFMAGQSDGFWFDFGQTDRLFQENIGPTAADDPNEVIGLALSQRLWNGQTRAQVQAAAANLVTPGSWAMSVAGASTAVESPAGTITLTPDGTNPANADQSFPTVAGRVYAITFTVENFGTPIVRAGSSQGASTYMDLGRDPGTYTHYIVAATTTTWLRFRKITTTAAVITGVSVKELSRQAGVQATASFKPKFQTAGAAFDGADDNLLTGYVGGAAGNFFVARIVVPPTLSSLTTLLGGQGGNRLRLDITSTGRLAGALGLAGFADTVNDLRGQTVIVGMSYDGATVRLFAGTSEVYSAAQPGAADTVTPLRIGATNASGTAAQFWPGSIKSILGGREFIDLARFNQIASQL